MIDPAIGLEEVMPLSERFLVSLAAFLESRVSPSVETIRPVQQSSAGSLLEVARLDGQRLSGEGLSGEGLEQQLGQVEEVLAVPEACHALMPEVGDAFMPKVGDAFMPEVGDASMPETMAIAEAAMMMADFK